MPDNVDYLCACANVNGGICVCACLGKDTHG